MKPSSFKKMLIFTTYFAIMLFSGSSCEKIEEPDPSITDADYNAKVYLKKEYMDVYYYWYKDVPTGVDVTKYDIYDYFDALLYSKDRWSWMMNKDDYVSSETGVVSGTYGASISQPIEYYNDYEIKVRYVYPDSPFAKEGVTRGWTLTHIAGTGVMDLIKAETFDTQYSTSPQTFTFRDLLGANHTFTVSAATSLSTRSYLSVQVFDNDDYEGLTAPVGYFNYLSFKAGMLEDIDNAMATFSSAGIKNLILDLRYNGGGDSRASQLLVNYLAPKSADNEVYVKRTHNDKLSSHDVSSKISRSTGSLNLDNLYVITGHGSASASEMVLNGLKPLMNVINVGDTTYGKPNGMYVLFYPGDDASYVKYDKEDYTDLKYVFLPICFYNSNKLGENIPDDGFVPVNYRPDDLYHDFTVNEDNIKACLNHIVNNTYPNLPAKTKAITKPSGRKISLSEEDINPNYGVYTVPKR
ncbi:MAG: S41 family peptidase [Bacteroidales bacterium]|nr:S41 family peptidase [Bacteroidales bacterium]